MLKGTGYFIWQLTDTLMRGAKLDAEDAKLNNMSHVAIKVADGNYSSNISINGTDLVIPYVEEFHKQGIEVWGWHYVYGTYAKEEAVLSADRCKKLNLDGFIIDAEVEYKVSGATKATEYCHTLRTELGTAYPIALSSFRFPVKYHSDFPWKPFIDHCDFMMPQVYWASSTNAGAQLIACCKEYAILTNKPIFPTGAAYQEKGWKPTESQILEFATTAKQLQLSGYNYWEWANSKRYNLWDIAMKTMYPIEAPVEPPPTDIDYELLVKDIQDTTAKLVELVAKL